MKYTFMLEHAFAAEILVEIISNMEAIQRQMYVL